MNRWLLIVSLLCLCAAACKKEASDAEIIQAQAVADSVIIHNYIVNNGLTSVAIKDKSTGEYYIIDTLGTTKPLLTSSTLITVGYTGSVLGSSTPFTQTNSFHPSYQYGQVITGWQIGLTHINKGGTIRLLIPSQYAYGAYAQPTLGLPANAVLDFTIKLYDASN